MSKPVPPFREAYDAYVILHYSTAPYAAIAAGIGESYGRLQARVVRLIRAGRLDPSTRYYLPPWSDAEVEYLREHWGRTGDGAITRHLQRSLVACQIRAKRLGLTRKGTMLTARSVARIFAMDGHCVTRWIELGWLAAKKSPIRCGRNQVWTIDEADVKRFVAAHPDAYDRTRIDPETQRYWRRLADRAAAARPERDGARPARFARHWTPREDAYLEAHWGQERDALVAAQLGRTAKACANRAYDIAITRHDALDGWLRAEGAARQLGVPYSRVMRWLVLGLLPATRSTVGAARPFWQISPQKLADFARAYPELLHPEQYLNASQAARACGVALPTLYGWVTAGQLRAHKSRTGNGASTGARWVITPADLAAYVAAHPELVPAQVAAA